MVGTVRVAGPVALRCAVLLACVASTPVFAQSAPPVMGPYVAHHVMAGKQRIDFETMLQRIRTARVVFLGEQHDDPATHALQLAVLDGLTQRGARVVLSLEMFERDVQGPLDAYLAGRENEAAFRAVSRPWPNYAVDYRPLVEYARAHGMPVIAANVPRSIASMVSRSGLASVDTLSAPGTAWVAGTRACGDNTAYARKFSRTMADMGGHGGPAMPAATVRRFYEAQCLKDETMAESVVAAMQAHPNAIIVHVTGGFHAEERLGTVERVESRVRSLGVTKSALPVILFVPHAGLASAEFGGSRKLGDYVVHVQRYAPRTGGDGAMRAPTGSADAVDTAVLMRRLTALAHDSMQGRGAGTPGGARARQWIEGELRRIGVSPAGLGYQLPVRVRPRPGGDSMGANIAALVRGASPTANGPVLVVSAHYDHLGMRGDSLYNGADDNASGSVALLALAEALTRQRPQHDVLLVWFDAEEGGMVGSRAFVEAPPIEAARIAANVNMDMVARHDAGALWVAGTSHYPLLAPIARAAAEGASVPVRLGHDTPSAKPSDDWTRSSDHASFHRVGIPFLYLGVEDHADYHGAGDDAGKVQAAFFGGTTSYAIALVRAMDASLPQLHAARAAASAR